jgi:hypothetical protein
LAVAHHRRLGLEGRSEKTLGVLEPLFKQRKATLEVHEIDSQNKVIGRHTVRSIEVVAQLVDPVETPGDGCSAREHTGVHWRDADRAAEQLQCLLLLRACGSEG